MKLEELPKDAVWIEGEIWPPTKGEILDRIGFVLEQEQEHMTLQQIANLLQAPDYGYYGEEE